MTGTHLLLVLALLLVVGEPLFVVISALAMLLLMFFDPTGPAEPISRLTQVVVEFATLAEKDPIIAIPLFTLAGTIMTYGGISARLVAVARALLGFLPGGLGMACVGACTLFAAISGSSAVTIIAIGGLIYPALRKDKFSEHFSLGLITSCGAIGILIPPSLPLIVYGVIASNATPRPELKPQITDLFQAGLVPSVLSVLALCAYCSAVAVWKRSFRGSGSGSEDAPRRDKFSFMELLATLKRGFFALALIVILLGGIYGGYTTATEASAVACVYALVVETFIHREIGAKDLLKIGRETVTLVGVILMVLVSALALGEYIKIQKIPDRATDRMQWDQITAKAELYSDAEFETVDLPVFPVANPPGTGDGQRFQPLDPAKEPFSAAPSAIGGRKPTTLTVVGRARPEGEDFVIDVKDPSDWEGAKTLRVPKGAVVERTEPLVHSRLGFLLLVNVLLLVVGSIMDIYSGIVVIAPLIVPMAIAYDVNLVHLGIIFVLNLELGLAHPPLGINLYIAQSYFRKSILEVTIAAIPFLVLLLGVLAAVTYWEPLSLWLVHHARPR